MTTASTPPVEPALFYPRPDIRLIAADLDGTLLDDAGELHDHFWPLVHELSRRGIVFCPASGRQYDNLLDRFRDVADEIVFVAENGAYVVDRGTEVSSDCVALDVVAALVRQMRALAESGGDVGVVVCGKRSAYIERSDTFFRAEVDRYYASLRVVDDLLTVTDDDVLKVAVYDFGAAEVTTAPALEPFRATHQVVVSGEHWVDVMVQGVDKGTAIRRLQQVLGITPAQTMVFGDFLNDLAMMDTAEYSFAVANAHPLLRQRARYLAPPNSANGVVRTISSVLGLTLPE